MPDELTELTAKMRKLVTDWIEVGGDVTDESFDGWLKTVREEAAAEAHHNLCEKLSWLHRDVLADAWEAGVLAKSNSSSIFDSDVLSENPYRGFPPMEGTKQ